MIRSWFDTRLLRIGSRFQRILFTVAFVYAIPVTAAQPPVQSSDNSKQHVIVVVGAAGVDEYKEVFAAWSSRWQDAAARADAFCTTIGETESPDTDLLKLSSAISEAISVETTEPLWIVFLGHGTFDGRTASLNLEGPDISAEEMAKLLQPAKRPVAFIACASCSAPFINTISGPGRIVISATKDGNQTQYSRFGDAMSMAINGLDADINRDGQTSLLEAWLFAARRTAEFYKTEGRLATEHALLDDNGDGKGTRAEVYEGGTPGADIANADTLDGKLAAQWNLVRSNEERMLSPEQRRHRDQLESQLDDLRRRKPELAETDYLNQLEAVLIPIARLYESIKPPLEEPQEKK